MNVCVYVNGLRFKPSKVVINHLAALTDKLLERPVSLTSQLKAANEPVITGLKGSVLVFEAAAHRQRAAL